MSGPSQQKPYLSTERDWKYLARNRRRAWFMLAAKVEDAAEATTKELAMARLEEAVAIVERLRSLGVPRADPCNGTCPDEGAMVPKEDRP